jgi:hypothetical protein
MNVFANHKRFWSEVGERGFSYRVSFGSCVTSVARPYGGALLCERWRWAQVADPKPPQAAVDKSYGGELCGNAGTMILGGTVERGERQRTVSEVSKGD